MEQEKQFHIEEGKKGLGGMDSSVRSRSTAWTWSSIFCSWSKNIDGYNPVDNEHYGRELYINFELQKL